MRTCDFCGKNIEHKRGGAKYCNDTCRSKFGQGLRARPSGETGGASSAAPEADPVVDLAAALGVEDRTVPDLGRADPESVSASRPAREPPHTPPVCSPRKPLQTPAVRVPEAVNDRADHDGTLTADVADLHLRLDAGLARLDERPCKADVTAMIKAALAPMRREIERVDHSSASTDTTDGLHSRVEHLEEQLLGYPQDR